MTDPHNSQPPIAPRQTDRHVWNAFDVSDPAAWTWHLTSAQIDELIALSDRHRLTDRVFETPPTMTTEIAGLIDELLHGRGFTLLRGFPSDEVGEEVSAGAFTALGALLGSARSQNAAGDLLGHVRNVGADVADPTVRIYQTNRRQTFHTDSTDVVALLCLQTAAEGGESLLVSAGAIYNEMLDRSPDLAAALFEPIATDRRGEIPAGADPWFTVPVLSWFDERLTVLYQRQYIDSASRFGDIAPLTERVTAALDLFDEIANDPAMHLRMELGVGDMQFVHNHTLLHDRTGFVDRPDSPRHLLRLWLSMPGDRPLPPIFAQRYGTVEVGNRGGIVVA